MEPLVVIAIICVGVLYFVALAINLQLSFLKKGLALLVVSSAISYTLSQTGILEAKVIGYYLIGVVALLLLDSRFINRIGAYPFD